MSIVNAGIGQSIEQALIELNKITLDLERQEAKFNKEIKKLEAKKTEATRDLKNTLVEREKHLLSLVKDFTFPAKKRSVKFDVGEVFVKKLPDKVTIKDEEKTIAALKANKLKNCIKTVETIIKKSVENLDDKTKKKCGITITPGEDKYYYALESSIKTSTGLVE